MDDIDQDLPTSPRKRLKMAHQVSGLPLLETASVPFINSSMIDSEPITMSAPEKQMQNEHHKDLHADDRRPDKEIEAGISEYICPDLPGFTGILKKRYSDFLVNEILPSGQVIHLDNLKPPKQKNKLASGTQTEQEPSGSRDETPDINEKPSGLPQSSDVVGPGNRNRQDSPARETVSQDTSQQIHVETEKTGRSISLDGPSDSQDVHGARSSTDGNPSTDRRPEASDPQARNPEIGVSHWQAFSENSGTLKLAPEDESTLKSFFDEKVVVDIVALFNRIIASPHRKIREYGSVKSQPIADKEVRTNVHKALRRIFSGRLESHTDDDGALVFQAAQQLINDRAGPNVRGRGRSERGQSTRGRGGRDRGGQYGNAQRPSWEELGGSYLHFSLYKENKDTMEVVSYLARLLNTKPQSFQFAGTKDRRGITVQRVSVYRTLADRMAQLARTLHGAKIGNYEYHSRGLELGELTGNEFVITLRDCRFDVESGQSTDDKVQSATHIVGSSMKHLVEHGFLNYFGLQRFGTFSTRTDTIGTKMLQGDFKGAVDAILKFMPESLVAAQNAAPSDDRISADDKARAWAINHFLTTGKSHQALDKLPRKFSAEANIIRHLGGHKSKSDYYGALQGIQRNLRLMYVHAYQSMIWNLAASYRWKASGAQVLEGDLVMVKEHKDKEGTAVEAEQVDADGEVIVRPADEDKAANEDDRFERARPLTKEEARSGRYAIFDVVLPTPGFDVLYPLHMVNFYEETMGSEKHGGLSPHDMRRPWKDISLSGSYRKLVARPGKDFSFDVRAYTNEDEQFVETDVDRLSRSKPQHNGHSHAPPAPAEIAPGGDGEVEGAAVPEEPPGDKAVEAEVGNAKVAAHGAEQEDRRPVRLAVVLKLQLGSSQYATMALRELMKRGGVLTYKPDFGGGR